MSDDRAIDVRPAFDPPPGFREVPSALPGITVCAPIPSEDQDQDADLTCPQCGATTAFEPAVGGLRCPFCGFVRASDARVVGRAAAANEFTLEALRLGEQGWGVARKELACDRCGAALAVEEGTLSARCAFCGAPGVHLREATSTGHRPGHLIPFSVLEEDLARRTRAWLGRGWIHPPGLEEVANIDRFTGIYVPFWVFDATIHGPWKAQVGHTETRRTSQGTRTVVVWRWESGRVHLAVSGHLVSGTSHLSSIVLERIEPFDLAELTEYDAELLAGWSAQTYDVSLPEAWETGRSAIRDRAKDAAYAQCSTSRVRSFSARFDMDDEGWRHVLLPVYVSAYRYKDRIYQVMVNGQTGQVGGAKPVAWWKVWPLIALMQLPGLATGLLGLVTLLLGGVGLIVLVFALLFAFLGLVGGRQLYRWAADKERA